MSQSPTIEHKIFALIARELQVSMTEVMPNKAFIDDLGADSLEIVQLVVALEEEFGIEISDDDTDDLRTVADAVAYIKANYEPKPCDERA
jgi:acyl carrier protein